MPKNTTKKKTVTKNTLEKKSRYINPFTDFGFKKLFGEEPNKDLLIDFLNELLQDEQGRITNITYLNNEHLGATETDRKAIFDLYCTNERGEKFIVELQKTAQMYFKDRSVYYATFPIIEQAQKGEWNYQLQPVYTIAILDFVFDKDEADIEKYRYDVKLTDITTSKVFYDKLKFVYLEMPKFNKKIDELHSHFDKWMYILRHLSTLEEVPVELKEKIFKKVFNVAELAKLTPAQARIYEDSLKNYRDIKNSVDTAEEKGRKEGREEGRKEGREEGREEGRKEGREEGKEEGKEEEKIAIAKRMLAALQVDIATVAKVTGLTLGELEKIQNR